jgi:hypothetical protein
MWMISRDPRELIFSDLIAPIGAQDKSTSAEAKQEIVPGKMAPLDPVIRRRPQVTGTEDNIKNAPNRFGRRVIAGNKKLSLSPIWLHDRILYVSQIILHFLFGKARYGQISFRFG